VIFKYSEYRQFITQAKKYPITTVADWDGSNAIILRHDVDLAIKPAYRLAQLEYEMGIRSTFCVLTTNPTYNPASRENRRMLHEMADMGFDVGLHFDPLIYPHDDPSELGKKVRQEAGWLESITGRPVRSVSLHNPSVHQRYPLFTGYKNAYDPEIFAEDRYMSDSRMHFRHNVFEFIERAKDRLCVKMI